MKFNQFIQQSDYKAAFNALRDGIATANGTVIKVGENNITAPATIEQEQPFLNTANNYIFEFGTAAPAPSATLNNIILGQNNAFVACAIQVLLGYGETANNRVYYSRGFTASDNSLYVGAQAQGNIESNSPVQKMPMLGFYEEGDFINGSGIVPIKPLRVVTGLVSKFQYQINFNNPISALTLSSNLFIRVILHGALGLA